MAESNRARDTFGGNGWWSPTRFSDPNHERQWLLDQAAAGSPDAHGELLNSYWRRMHRYCRREMSGKIAGKVDLDELVQDVCEAALKGFSGFQGGPLAKYLKWLMAICRNHVCTVLRRYLTSAASREEPLDEQALDAGRHAYGRQLSPDDILAALEDRAELQAALAQLPADQRQAVQWRYFEKLSRAEVAGRLGLSLDGVKRILKSAVQTLKRRLATGHG